MSGRQDVTPFGFDSSSEDAIDAGTLSLMSTPTPAASATTRTHHPVAQSRGPADVPLSGGIPYAVGQASIVRIPVPGTNGLAIELQPRGWVPKSGSTSTLFFQDPTGKRHLRLDYGFNTKTNTVDYHWNQRKVSEVFSVVDHTPAGNVGAVAYTAAKYFRYAGRVLVIAGVAVDVVSIVQASKPLRRASEVVTAWALAWVGCKAVGAGGAAIGSAITVNPLGTAIGGAAGCIVGGLGGYYGGAAVGGDVYDWAEGTLFTPLDEAPAP